MKIIYNSSNEKKDIVKANNSVDTVKDILDTQFTCTAIIIFDKEQIDEETGDTDTKTVVALKNSNGGFYTSISPTVKSSVEAIVEAYTQEEITSGIDIIVKSKESKAGRDFYYVDLV